MEKMFRNETEIKNKKRKLALVLVMVSILSLLLTGCKTENIAEQKENVWGQWEYCVKANELVYDTMLWALDEAQVFSQELSWESLLNARAVVSSAKLRLENVELLGYEVDEEDYLVLLDAGLEPEVVLTEYEGLETLFEQSIITLTCLEEMLMSDICLSPNAMELENWLNNCRELVVLSCKSMCLTTNYLMLQWGNSEQWQMALETYPTIAFASDEWSDDPEQLMSNQEEVLDCMSNLQLGKEEYFGISSYTKNLVWTATQTGAGLQKLLPYLQPIRGVETYFPIPSWLSEKLQIVYYTVDAEGAEPRLIQQGDSIATQNCECYISCDGIQREEVDSYSAQLRSYGMQVDTLEEENACIILCTNGTSEMKLQWENGETDIYLQAPMGCMVPEWYLYAITSK